MSEPTGFICGPRIYKFNGWIFEYGQTGCWPLKKDFAPRKRAGMKFYTAIGDFYDMTKEEKEKHRIGGGCIRF